jgi:hypothetical protein
LPSIKVCGILGAKPARRLVLGDTTLSVRLVTLEESCPDFEGPLLYKVRFPVSVEVSWIFVTALEGAPPAVTTENMNDLFLLCEEFGFASLLSHVTNFISVYSVVDYEVRKRVSE